MVGILRTLRLMGFNPKITFHFFKELPSYIRDKKNLKTQLKNDGQFPFGKIYPILSDKKEAGGQAKGHYFHQDLLVAQKIFENKPLKHIDIGSRVDGFIAHVATFREIELFDIRPLAGNVRNIIFKQADLMHLPDDLVNCCDSVSSLHAIEHFGLGRYNDPIDAYGHIKAIENIHKILKVNGTFYFSVPIGPQRIEFNAHRVFSLDYLLNLFYSKFEIKSFSFVDDKGDLHSNVRFTEDVIKNNFNCFFGCGIFELIKI